MPSFIFPTLHTRLPVNAKGRISISNLLPVALRVPFSVREVRICFPYRTRTVARQRKATDFHFKFTPRCFTRAVLRKRGANSLSLPYAHRCPSTQSNGFPFQIYSPYYTPNAQRRQPRKSTFYFSLFKNAKQKRICASVLYPCKFL